jgi:hypothetical protein
LEFEMPRIFALIAVGSALLMACTMENQPPAARPDAAPVAAIVPVGNPAAARISDSSSTTTTTVTGNTTRTETRSSSVSVDGAGLLDALLGASGQPAARAGNVASDYVGTWRVTSPNNRECRLTLQPASRAGAPANVQNSGCFQELFGTTRWSLRGNDLVLADAFGNVKATLRATARDRLDGDGVTMWR